MMTARSVETQKLKEPSRNVYSRERELKREEVGAGALRRLFLLSVSLCGVLISTSCSTLANAHRLLSTYVVGRLLILIALLVLSSLGLIWSTLLVVQGLPSLTEDLADLACNHAASACFDWKTRMDIASHTEADARVLIADVLTLLVGEEHVGRETALGRVGIFKTKLA